MKLKKVPSKNKGLGNLPSKVRNKMGYMKTGGAVKVKYKEGGKNPTKKIKENDEEQINRRYETIVGTNPRTGKLNFPNSSDMDKVESTAGTAGDPNKLREAVSDKYYADERKRMGIDKIKTYKKGGAVKVKYKEGGKLTEKDMDKMQKRADDDNRFEYKGEDYMQQNASEIKDSASLLKFFKVKETAKGLSNMGISTKGMTPEKILSAGKTKGVEASSSARKLFDAEISDRKLR